MKNKLLSLLLAASVTASVTVYSAAVDSFSINPETNSLTVSGSFDNIKKYDTVSFALLKGNVNSATETKESILSEFVTFANLLAGENGSYSIEINMDGMDTGDYTVRLRAGGINYEEKIYYSNPFDKANTVSDILSKTTPEELANYLDIKNPESSPLKKLEAEREFISYADPIETAGLLQELILNETETITPEKMKELIKNAAIISRVNNGSLNPYDEKEALMLEPEFVSEYENSFDDEEKKNFTEYTKGKGFRSFLEIKEDFGGSVISALADMASTNGEFQYILNTYYEKIVFNKASYDSLSTANLLKLYEYLASCEIKNILSLKELIDLKTAELSAIAPQPPAVGGGGGGGGGGGASSGKGSESLFVEESNPPEITPEKTESHSFSDMQNYEWATEAVETLFEAGIISGISEKEFAPEKNLKREELVKILVGVYEKIKGETAWEYKEIFSDASEIDWYTPYVIKAYELGITKGISEKLFGAGEFVKREDVAVLITRTAEIINKEIVKKEEKEIADWEQISDYAKEAVKALSVAGVISGNENGEFMPKKSCKRAQAAKMIYMALISEGN